MVYYLSFNDLEFICNELEGIFTAHKDPVPEFNMSTVEKVESVIATPQKTFFGIDLYKDIFTKAACYFYFINKLHPFYNGNKRMSIVSTYVFLRKNNYLFTVEEASMYEFAKSIANSHRKQDVEFQEVVTFIKENTVQG